MTHNRRSNHETARRAAHGLAALVVAATLIVPAAAGAGSDGIGASDAAVRRALDGHMLRTLDGQSLHAGIAAGAWWSSTSGPPGAGRASASCRRSPRSTPSCRRVAGECWPSRSTEDARNVERFVREHRLTLPVAQDGPDGLARALDLRYVPAHDGAGPRGGAVALAWRPVRRPRVSRRAGARARAAGVLRRRSGRRRAP